MDLSFSDEQVLLRDSIHKYLNAKYDTARTRIVASAEGYSRECWQEFAELGFLAAPFAEEYGGLGSGTVETMIIMEEYGRRLVVEPFVETVVLAGGLLRDLGPKTSGKHSCRASSTAATSGPWPGPRRRAGTIFTTFRCAPNATVMATG
jgi:alkylation response protein AidB-like acyl-CoA dehydrogenase